MGRENNHENHRLVLVRHGETEWSKTGQHTSRTDLELTETGRNQAVAAGQALAKLHLDNPVVITSPRRRAVVTAELAGLVIDEETPLIAEWDYGAYEGLTTAQIRESDPDWLVWTHGCPDGETTTQVAERADAAVALALDHMASRDVLFVGHGHFSRAVIARWIELALIEGSRFGMAAGSVAVCGFEHGIRQVAVLGCPLRVAPG
ncbi:acid phosphatase [Mycobacterium sp.]|uniref:acid phosphatase n=1 Tax=Mycobacterium sp. TaxID=1785 RepID=UPI001275339E|nr:acid phosphatase [Mycobacterium sp.]KAA8958997.1 MAG: acid phosphatase [Mycobacterium sp.]